MDIPYMNTYRFRWVVGDWVGIGHAWTIKHGTAVGHACVYTA